MSNDEKQLEGLDAFFGVHTHKVGDATLRVRRVLTKEQQRSILEVVREGATIGQEVVKLEKEFVDTPKGRDKLHAAVEDMEESLRLKMLTAIGFLCLDDIPGVGTLSLTTVTWLFNELRGVVENTTDKAIRATGFPTKGA